MDALEDIIEKIKEYEKLHAERNAPANIMY